MRALREIAGPENVTTDPADLARLSRDYYWFSPLLEPQLDGKVADVAVSPTSAEALTAIVQLAVRREVPVTVRGAGTGNYGQAVPLRGGLVLHLRRLARVGCVGRGEAVVQAGARLGAVERQARPHGYELRIYPSTYITATVGGFVAGGSAGIGSITWGNQWDGNVLAASAVTMEDPPRRVDLRGEELRAVIHAFGTTAVLTDVTIPLAPATAWAQSVLAFPQFDGALAFAREVAEDDGVRKRLVSVHEWPIPSYFGHLRHAGAVADGQAHLLLEVDAEHAARVCERAARHGGTLTWQLPGEAYHVKGPSVSDFSFNHTTLWAKRADPGLTYLQVSFSPREVAPQVARLRQRFGGTCWVHIEYLRSGGVVVPSGLLLVRFRGRAGIEELVTFLEATGAPVRNPYSCRLDTSRNRHIGPILRAKRAWDPRGLLNPGKLDAEAAREGGELA